MSRALAKAERMATPRGRRSSRGGRLPAAAAAADVPADAVGFILFFVRPKADRSLFLTLQTNEANPSAL